MDNKNIDRLLFSLEETKFGTQAFRAYPIAFTFPAGDFGNRGSFRSFNFPAGNFGDFSSKKFNNYSLRTADFSPHYASNYGDFFTCFGNFDSCFSHDGSDFGAHFTNNYAFKAFSNLNPLSFDEKTMWDDIVTIYNNLNLTKAQYNITQTTVPDYSSEKTVTQHINDLQSLIQAMSSNSHIGNNASTSSVAMPNTGDLLKTSPFEGLNEVIKKVHDNCISFIGTNFS